MEIKLNLRIILENNLALHLDIIQLIIEGKDIVVDAQILILVQTGNTYFCATPY